MSSFPSLLKRRLKRHLLRNQTRRSTAIRIRVTPSLAITENSTTLSRLTLPTGGQANFYINNCGDFRWLQRLRATRIAFAFRQDGIFAELKSAVGNELSKAGLMLFAQLDQGGCV